MTQKEIAYIAGLFDGEGSVSFIYRNTAKKEKRYPKIEAKITNSHRPTLEWICNGLGIDAMSDETSRVVWADKKTGDLGDKKLTLCLAGDIACPC